MSADKYPNVFQPFSIRRVQFKNRIQFSPMVACVTTANGEVNQEMVDWVGFQARTGVGYITIGETQIDPARSTCFYGELNVTHDKYIAGLTLISEEAHRYGCRLSIELNHSGRGANPAMNSLPAFAPSKVPLPGGQQNIKIMDREDMAWVKRRWAECAVRCKRAGFDIVMVHSGSNHLLAQFLSPEANRRDDAYGGSLENRMRYPLEVLEAVRESVGDDFPIEMKVSVDDAMPGGLVFEDTLAYLQEAQKYVDIVCLTRGNIFTHAVKYSVPSYLMPHMLHTDWGAKVKVAIGAKVQVVGNIVDLSEAEQILAAGKADIVGMCRSLMAGPDMLANAVLGRESETRPCIRCMDGCGAIYRGEPVRCSVNPTLGRETRYRQIEKTEKKRRVYVVGAGPAGMQAVETLLKRGHDVTLFDKANQLGGKLHDASALKFKTELRRYKDWFIRRTAESRATIRLNTEVTAGMIAKEKPDAVIVATGASYAIPSIPGIDGKNVVMARDVDSGRVAVGERVIVCGGGLTGVESALQLARDGKDVRVIDRIPVKDFCNEQFPVIRISLMDAVEEAGVKLCGEKDVIRFTENGVVIEEKDGTTTELKADTCVIAFGLVADNSLCGEIAKILPLSTYSVGDCTGAKNVFNATFAAFNVAVEI